MPLPGRRSRVRRAELELPGRGKEGARVVGMHDDVDCAVFLVDEEHALPASSTVGGAEDSALLLRPVAVTLSRDEDDVRVRRDGDAGDTAVASSPTFVHVRPASVDL